MIERFNHISPVMVSGTLGWAESARLTDIRIVLTLVCKLPGHPSIMVTLQESPAHPLSERSTAAIPDSVFHAADFVLGAGVVIIQPSTSKIVLVTDKHNRWFLPKGRKDKGESLEQTALREAYEEVNNRSFYLILSTPYSFPISCFDLEADPRILLSLII